MEKLNYFELMAVKGGLYSASLSCRKATIKCHKKAVSCQSGAIKKL